MGALDSVAKNFHLVHAASQPSLSFVKDPLSFLPIPVQQYCGGNVSKTMLLTVLLPLSFLSIFGTLIIAAQDFPGDYDWKRQVISHLISPRYNPDGFILPSIGMALSAIFSLPVAGYISQRLRDVSPRLSHWVGVGLGVGIFLVVTVTLPFNTPSMPESVHWVHEALARTGAVGVVGGMILCSVIGLLDRLSGRRMLDPRLVISWASLTLVPVVCGILAGILKFSRKAGFEWAIQLRQELKQTMLLQLAFWEWVGVIGFVFFMVISVLLLPARVKESR